MNTYKELMEELVVLCNESVRLDALCESYITEDEDLFSERTMLFEQKIRNVNNRISEIAKMLKDYDD